MDHALALHRLQFAFTITFHYLFAQLSMGLALLILLLKTAARSRGNDYYNQAARLWIRVLALCFVIGVVTGLPMEFQFGTNWAAFSKAAGAVIGQTLAMEGVFAFFLESTLIGLLLFGEKRLSARAHWMVSLLVWLGTWLSAYFILATNAWMQHPVGYKLLPGGRAELESLAALLLNPWLGWMFLHNQLGTVVTAGFFMASVGAFYLLTGRHQNYARTYLRLGVISAGAASILMLFPTGHGQARNVALHQPAGFAGMEALFQTTQSAPMAVLGQPDVEAARLDNPVLIPGLLSFLTYGDWNAEVKGLDAFPRGEWPDQIPLLYYSYRIMIGLGSLFIAVSLVSWYKLARGNLYRSRSWLWILMLMAPFPFIANTAGWMTAELGRQPWLVYGVMRTAQGASAQVSSGNALFTIIGFVGLYLLLGMLFLYLLFHEIDRGPGPEVPSGGPQGH